MILISNIAWHEKHFHTFQIVINVRFIKLILRVEKNCWNIEIPLVHTFSPLPLHLINYLNGTCTRIRKFSPDIFYNDRYIEI